MRFFLYQTHGLQELILISLPVFGSQVFQTTQLCFFGRYITYIRIIYIDKIYVNLFCFVWYFFFVIVQFTLSSFTSNSVISPLTVQTVTIGDFTLPITRLFFYVERQTRRASNLFHTGFSAPEGQNAFMQFLC